MDSGTLLAKAKKFTRPTLEMHSAINSLREELEAIDLYNQRLDLCKDAELKTILKHNRDEEKEHAAMLIEWISRADETFALELKEVLFTKGPIEHA
jgi:hypothetical protein